MPKIIQHEDVTYTVVPSYKGMPGAYKVWNIGEHAPRGYIPFCRLADVQPFPGGTNIDTTSLFAVHVPADDWYSIMKTACYGTTPDELLTCFRKNGTVPVTSPKSFVIKRIKDALPAWFRLFYPTENPYETACRAYGLLPPDIHGLIKLDRYAQYHTHKVMASSSGSLAICSVCGNTLGWYCPDSPTHLCDYQQEDGSYDEDSCRYCGQPEERK